MEWTKIRERWYDSQVRVTINKTEWSMAALQREQKQVGLKKEHEKDSTTNSNWKQEKKGGRRRGERGYS